MALSNDPADLFVQVYDQLEVSDFRTPERVAGWLADPAVRDICLETEREALEWGLDPEEVESSIVRSSDPTGRRLGILLGLQRALSYAHPVVGTHAPNQMSRVALRYARFGRFSTEGASGALLPRFVLPRQVVTPIQPAELFSRVVRVPEEEWSQADHFVAPRVSDFMLDVDVVELAVGFAPVASDPSDVAFHKTEHSGKPFFRLEPADHSRLRAAISAIVQKLDTSAASIGVMPEAVLDQELLDWWVEELRSNPRPPTSRVEWILVGSGPIGDADPPPNRAFLLDRTRGRVICSQDKIHPFVLSPDQLRTWGLNDTLGEHAIQEDITSGDRIAIVESNAGRFAILVCEDLSRIIELGPTLRAHGVSLILAPVFSEEIQKHHWEHAKSKDFVQEIGSRAAIANSLVVARLKGLQKAGTCIAVSGSGAEVGEATDNDDLIVLSVPIQDLDLDR